MDYQFLGINHVQLAAPEHCEQQARQFFGSILGWIEIAKPEALKHRGGVWFQCGVHEVHIGVQKDFTAATKAHPAFQVQQIEHLRAHLIKQHIHIIDDDMRDKEGVKRFYVHDPFGNRIEFLELLNSV